MATWKPENVLLTLKGNEALSKVLAGQGKLTVTRIVTGAGYVSPSTLYNQKDVSDIKQTLEISRVVTNANGSEISTTLSNINLDTAYSLYQIGVYCRHTDSDEEFLYLIAQCETDKPDTIPAKTDTIANFSYNLYIQHEGTTQFEVTVNQSGVLDVGMLGKPNGVAGLDSEGLIPKEAIPNASKIYLSDGVTSVEEAIANGSDVFIATYGTTTSAEIESAYQAGKAVFCQYTSESINRIAPLVRRNTGGNIFDFFIPSVYDKTNNEANVIGGYFQCVDDGWACDLSGLPRTHASTHVSGGSDPITPEDIGAIATTEKGQADGVASLDSSGKVPSGQLPEIGYTKEETLSDATKTAFGLGADAVPDDVLASLGRLNSALPNDKIWRRIAATISDIETVNRTEGTSGPYLMRDTSTETIREIYYSDELSADENGNIALKNYKTLKFSIRQWPNYTTFFAGKYIKNEQSFPNDIYFIPNGVTLTGTATGGYYYAYFDGTTKRVTGANVSVVSSDLINTPADKDSEDFDDGKNYIFLGTIGGLLTGGVHIETGSYVGTGTYGPSNPNSLTFEFEPKLVFMFEDKLPLYKDINSQMQSPVYGTTIGMTTTYSKSLFNIYSKDNYFYAKKSSDGKTLSWYHEANASAQINKSGVTYQYIAIG